jgi:hypothetical protein
MNSEWRYTKHQVARGARADAERNDAVFLLKNVSSLRLTYQIRLLTLRAMETRRTLVIRVPAQCQLHGCLREFQAKHSTFLRIEKV